jgi:hypothetical protein
LNHASQPEGRPDDRGRQQAPGLESNGIHESAKARMEG